MSDLPPSLQAARDRLNGNYYGLCYLSLVTQAYAACPVLIPQSVAAMPVPSELAGKASWQCVWGPASDSKTGDLNGPNLMFVVVLNDTTSGTAVPAFAVVVLRGTDLALTLV